MKFTHLCFADDIMVFADGERKIHGRHSGGIQDFY